MTKKIYIKPEIEKVNIHIESHILDLSFSDEEADGDDALAKPSLGWDDNEKVNTTEKGDVYIGTSSIWDD